MPTLLQSKSSLNAIIPLSGCLPLRIHPSKVGWALAAHAFLSSQPYFRLPETDPFHRVGINAYPTPKQSSLNAITPLSGCPSQQKTPLPNRSGVFVYPQYAISQAGAARGAPVSPRRR
nr:hypothetical protein [uncultured Kingella sp.]